jgi:poly(3-hydroxybutyrate) depolymerase
MADSLAMWTEGFGCQADPASSTEGALTRTNWTGRTGNSTATLIVIAGADHPWPGSEPPRVRLPNQGVPTDLLDATEALATFFGSIE